MHPTRPRHTLSRGAIALIFCAAGGLHFIFPQEYVRIIPPLFPMPYLLVLLSGVCEILGGAGVMIPRVRLVAGYGLIGLLIAVFPANIYMAARQSAHGWSPATLLLLLRLPLQFVLIAWVYQSACRREPELSSKG